MARARKGEEESQLLTRPEAAAYLGVAVQTLAIWRSTDRYKLPMVKVGRLVKYRRGDLDAFIAAGTSNQTTAVTPINVTAGVQPVSPAERRADNSANQQKVGANFAPVEIVDQSNPQATNVRASDEAASCVLDVRLQNGITLGLRENCSLEFLKAVMNSVGGFE